MKKVLVALVVLLPLSAVTGSVSAGEEPGPKCTIEGTDKADILIGTPGNDVICGFGRADTIKGRGGNDRLYGGMGNDLLIGGEGNDRIYGERHVDKLLGGPGKDHLEGNDPDSDFHDLNFYNGGPGDDEIDGTTDLFMTLLFNQGGPAVIVDLRTGTAEGQGTDAIEGTLGEVRGTDSDDRLIADEKQPQVHLLGLRGDDFLRGNNLYGGRGNDELRGTRFADYFEPGRGDDLILGDENEADREDEINFGRGPVRVEVKPNKDKGESDGVAVGEGRDIFESIGSFLLTGSDDRFLGDSRPNEVLGEGGNDLLRGSGNADRLRGGKGADNIRAEGGDDYLDGGDDKQADKLHGGKGNDTCVEDKAGKDTFSSCETRAV